ncbi:MAG: nicotinate phosphoribosyltransferase [Armatimonadetes bacterium]|nr:nicotinate phosphoribosyltransferase [Armatimonadota bacterium]
MSIADGRRLPVAVFRLDVERLRQGWYSDQYFNNLALILGQLAAEGYHYRGNYPHPGVAQPERVEVGNLEVEMQFFAKREPFCIAAGVDNALAILSSCCGYHDGDRFVPTADRLQVEAVQDGDRLAPWEPAIRVRGRYRDFATLETPLLGALARRSRIATNVYESFVASRGKMILFFPARFDIHETQAGDGYAYRIGLERYRLEHEGGAAPMVSTHAQGDWWGQRGGGTIAHAYILSFLADTAEAALQFARIMPPETPRIALVDTNNDCVTDSLRCARALFAEYLRLTRAQQSEEARKYVLSGVRADTSERLCDASVEPLGDPRLDCGVTPRLVLALRRALDAEGDRIEVPAGERELAQRYFRGIRIVVTGGFDPDKIALFERLGLPVDTYGVGSYLLRGPSNDFTADVVRVKIDGRWIDLAKVGRGHRDNPDLRPISLPLPAS